MIQAGRWSAGICSWSLKNDRPALEQLKKETGIEHIHLDLNPALDGNPGWPAFFQREKWNIVATMVGFPQEDYTTPESIRLTGGIVPDEYWETNRQRVLDSIDITSALGVSYLEFHFGFLGSLSGGAVNALVERTAFLAAAAEKKGVVLLMETGQETPAELLEFMQAISSPALAVNFDPGNLLLYGKGDPVEALGVLSPWIKNIHAKDALPPPEPGQWGKEMVWGQGAVNAEQFLRELSRTPYAGTLCVEREAGLNRYEDIKAAIKALSAFRE